MKRLLLALGVATSVGIAAVMPISAATTTTKEKTEKQPSKTYSQKEKLGKTTSKYTVKKETTTKKMQVAGKQGKGQKQYSKSSKKMHKVACSCGKGPAMHKKYATQKHGVQQGKETGKKQVKTTQEKKSTTKTY